MEQLINHQAFPSRVIIYYKFFRVYFCFVLDVIVSLVRTKTMGFLSDSRRLDMAISRASENLILLGSHRLFVNDETSFFHNIPTGPFQLQSGHVLKNVEEISKYVYELSVSKLNQ